MSEQTASLDGRVDDVTIDWQRLVNDRPVGPSGSSVLTEDDTTIIDEGPGLAGDVSVYPPDLFSCGSHRGRTVAVVHGSRERARL